MKKGLLAFGLILVGSFAFSQSIKFETETIDYGTVKKGSDKTRVIKFKNVGDKPLILTDVKASCGCTTPSWPKEPIMPGKSSEIVVSYDTNIVGPFSKTVTVSSNDEKFGRKVINIKGVVVDD